MFLHTVPSLVQRFYPERIWMKSPADNKVYLTFDDGPVAGVTEYVLNELSKRNQKATFFVVGDNVRKSPELAKELISAGNKIGNHTFNHLNGWKTEHSTYLENIELCDDVLRDVLGIKTKLFRPPYGLIKRNQAIEVSRFHEIVMWSVLTGDYDQRLNAEVVLNKSIQHTKAGSVVLFHDQLKTKAVLPKVLPPYLDYIKESGWETGLL